MNLLIVDDQPLVTDGLEQGIPWESLGFRNIFKAYNALDEIGRASCRERVLMPV